LGLFVLPETPLHCQCLQQDRQHSPILITICLLLGFDHGRELKDTDPHVTKLIQNGTACEILVGKTISNSTEDVESSKLGEEEMRPQGFEFPQIRLDMPTSGIAIASLELPKRCEKTIKVLRGFVVQDVQVQCQDGSSLKLGSHSTDNKEIDSMTKQGPEEPEELNARRLVHAGAP